MFNFHLIIQHKINFSSKNNESWLSLLHNIFEFLIFNFMMKLLFSEHLLTSDHYIQSSFNFGLMSVLPKFRQFFPKIFPTVRSFL